MAEIRGDLTVKVMNGVNLKNMDVFGTCNPYVLVKLRSSVDSMTTAVKDGEDNPSWQETFIFRGVACTDGLQISLMEKEGGREGVVSVAEYIPPSLWGFPGIGGAEREVQVTMPSTAGRKSDRPSVGTVVIRLQYRAELPLRPAFGLLKMAAVKTGVLTEKAKIDYAVGVIINLLQLSSRPVTMVGGMADNMTKTQKIATGSAIAIAGMGVVTGLMALAIPVALVAIFFPPRDGDRRVRVGRDGRGSRARCYAPGLDHLLHEPSPVPHLDACCVLGYSNRPLRKQDPPQASRSGRGTVERQ